MTIGSNVFTCFPNAELRARGAACLRIAADLRGMLEITEDLDPGQRQLILADVAELEAAGNWLVGAQTVNLYASRIPAAGHAAEGFPANAAHSTCCAGCHTCQPDRFPNTSATA